LEHLRFKELISSDEDSEANDGGDDDDILQVIKVNNIGEEDSKGDDMIPQYTLHERSLVNVRNTISHQRKISHDLQLIKVDDNAEIIQNKYFKIA